MWGTLHNLSDPCHRRPAEANGHRPRHRRTRPPLKVVISPPGRPRGPLTAVASWKCLPECLRCPAPVPVRDQAPSAGEPFIAPPGALQILSLPGSPTAPTTPPPTRYACLEIPAARAHPLTSRITNYAPACKKFFLKKALSDARHLRPLTIAEYLCALADAEGSVEGAVRRLGAREFASEVGVFFSFIVFFFSGLCLHCFFFCVRPWRVVLCCSGLCV